MHAAAALITASPSESLSAAARQAAAEACAKVQREGGRQWTAGFLFTCGDFNQHFDEIMQVLNQELSIEHAIGSTAEAVVGNGEEVENGDALSLLTIRSDQPCLPLHLDFVRSPDGGSIIGWPDEWLDEWPPQVQMVLLADPFSFPTDLLLEQTNAEHPGATIFGGMASGAAQPGDNRLGLNRDIYREGCVGLAFPAAPWSTIVSQGCRPIGNPLVITKVERNIIHELSGLPAYEQLMRIYNELPNHEKQLAERGLHLGRVVSEYLEEFTAGDFLVRNVLGGSREDQTVTVGEYMRVGQTVQFHLRDAESADSDLTQTLRRAEINRGEAALVFTCNGRGTRLFPEPHHDALAVERELGEIPIAGFFAQGEIGPVAGENYLHGYTASVAVLESRMV